MRIGLPLRFAALVAALLGGVAGLGMVQPEANWGQLAWQSVGLAIGRLPAHLYWAELPLLLDLARLACPLALAWAVIGMVRAVFGNRVALARMRARGEHIVVSGTGPLARTLVFSELSRRQPVVVVGHKADATWIAAALRKGAAICADFADCGLETARALAIAGTDGRANIAQARAVVTGPGPVRSAANPLEIVAIADNEDPLDREAQNGLITASARVRTALLPDMVARQLFRDHSLDAFRWAGHPECTVVIIGFSHVTRPYIVRQLTAGHWRGGRRVRLVVIDTDPAVAQAKLKERHGAVDALSPIVFMRWDGTGLDLARRVAEIEREHGHPVAYVIDAGTDSAQLELAAVLIEAHETADVPLAPIHARLEDVAPEAIPAGVHAFGHRGVMEDPDALTQERHDETARAIHEFYLEGRLGDGERIGARESLREWEELPERYRADNRMVADCHTLKLRDIGARVVAGGPGRATLFRLRHDEQEELARAEHDRWMVAKLADGWEYGAVRDDAARLHPDIVPYDSLSEAIKDLDREQVHVITRIVARQGGAVVRLLDIALIVTDDDAVPFGPLLAALATHYPDRLPRFSVVAGCPAMLQSLIGHGALVRLIASHFAITPAGIDAVIAVSKGDERQALCGNTELCIAWGTVQAPVGQPLIRLDRAGAIEEAPWLP